MSNQDRLTDSHELAAELVRELIRERRSEKRWKNIRFFVVFLFVVFIAVTIFSNSNGTLSASMGEGPYVSLMHLDGMIASDKPFSAEGIEPLLKQAFADKEAKGVVLVVDSGGGSPVQASIIHDLIIEYKNKYHKKVVVVGEDLLASGAYYVAVAADKIFVNPNTLTGSIGVIMKGFGFNELMNKVGIERRVYTAGANKDRLDPFVATTPEDIAKIEQVLTEVHGNFTSVVLEGRKGKLRGDPKELFSGDFWSGQTALKLGLVDGLGNVSNVMQSEFNVSRYKEYGESVGLFQMLINQFGTTFDTAVANSAAWLRLSA